MNEYARAPDQMFTKVALEDVIDTIQGAHADMNARYAIRHATELKSSLCCRCKTPFGEWDTLHPLFRSWSTKCPDCHTRDIQLDFAHQNQED